MASDHDDLMTSDRYEIETEPLSVNKTLASVINLELFLLIPFHSATAVFSRYRVVWQIVIKPVINKLLFIR